MKIYKITNTITTDFYIGKTEQSIENRWSAHKYNTIKTNSQTHLYRAMRKYGLDNFVIETIDTAPNKIQLNEKEIFWISELKPKYNMTKGGDGGDNSQSPNFIKSMRIYHSTKDKSSYATYGMLGKTTKEETKRKISTSNSCPVVCDGIEYASVGEAQQSNPGISIRKRLDSPKYPNFYRLKEKIIRK